MNNLNLDDLAQESNKPMIAPQDKKNIVELKPQQEEAFEKILEFFNDKEKEVFSLIGYAGTGKSFLLQEIIKRCHKKFFISITATTNKAVVVVKDIMEKSGIHVQVGTIHQLLGIKPAKEMIDGVMTEVFKPSGLSNVSYNQIVIIDEASMIGSDLYDLILDSIAEFKLKVLFVGDSAQLPPVEKDKDETELSHTKKRVSRALEEPDSVQLTEIIRQGENNPVRELLTYVRENLTDSSLDFDRTDNLNLEEKIGVKFYSSYPKFLRHMYDAFAKVKDTEDFGELKVLAWTNNVVKNINQKVRKSLYGDVEHFQTGEWVIARSPVIVDDMIVLQNSEEACVISRQPIKILELDGHLVELQRINGGITYVQTLIGEEKTEFNKVLNKKKKKALNSRDRKDWLDFYRTKEIIADIDYAYALTVHKSQGSTFKHVFVLENNINLNKRIVERNQCKYVAFSRPTNFLFVYG